VTAATTSGIGAKLGEQLAPEGHEAEGAALGSMVPGAKRIPGRLGESPSETATRTRMEKGYAQAKELGVPIHPGEMKHHKPQQKLQDTSNKELGQPAGTEITPQSLKAYRGQRYQEGYAPVIKAMPEIIANDAYGDKIKAIASEERKLRK